MASALEQAVSGILLNDYISLVVITAVGYDYILTFSSEVEYIWNKPWTRVSTLYVLARYCGLCAIILLSIVGSSFLPNPANVYVSYVVLICKHFRVMDHIEIGYIIYLADTWTVCIFMLAADLIMVLRVWALYNRSRLILAVLLTFYGVEVVSFLVLFIIYDTQLHSALGTTQVFHFSLCILEVPFSVWAITMTAGQIIVGTLMCLLTAHKFMQELLQMYRATKSFQLNQYMKLLVRDGMIYFATILLYSVISLMGNLELIQNSTAEAVLSVLQEIPTFTLIPRFILSLRELYARDLRRGGSNIDTAFGLSSRSAASTIIFAGVGEHVDGVEMEEMEQVDQLTISSA